MTAFAPIPTIICYLVYVALSSSFSRCEARCWLVLLPQTHPHQNLSNDRTRAAAGAFSSSPGPGVAPRFPNSEVP
uniref:Putative secreted peptide n=1 Tax=Anopheles braziliensis TaxID=58242 RepID=A0A2M3ZTE6_9DIPT